MPRLLSKIFGRFLRERKSSTTVEFAIVGSIYLTILFFVIQGGIFYIKVTVLDVAAENAARVILLNQNPNTNITTPPITASAFAALVAQDSFGVLKAANIVVALQEEPPITSGGNYGFQAMTPYTFPANGTPPYQFTLYGACPVNYQYTVADNGVTASAILQVAPTNGTITACTGTCSITAANGNNGQSVIVGGIADDGTSASTSAFLNGHTFYYTTFTDGTYTCGAGQDILLQVQYTDPNLVSLVGKYFGTIVSTVAFQIEPPPV